MKGSMKAKKTGRCSTCLGHVHVDDPIYYYPAVGDCKAEVVHVDCSVAEGRGRMGPAQNLPGRGSDFYLDADCSECGSTWAGLRLPRLSPCCQAVWEEHPVNHLRAVA